MKRRLVLLACCVAGLGAIVLELQVVSAVEPTQKVAHVGFVSPTSFTFLESVLVLSIVVLGGLGSTVGVVLAAIVLTLLFGLSVRAAGLSYEGIGRPSPA